LEDETNMSACKRSGMGVSSLTIALLAGLAAAACTVPTNDEGDANARVQEVVVVGTSVTSSLYVSGDLGLTTVPKDDKAEVVLDKTLKVDIKITSPSSLSVQVDGTECTAPDAGKKSIAVGVVIDDSGSMASNDEKMQRKDATIGFLKTLGPEDKVLLTDYGLTGQSLRDLLCISSGKPTSDCSPPKANFSADKDALVKATEKITDGGGTPLYEACVQMIPLIDSIKDQRRGMLLLSDGEPNTQTQRDACHAAAKAAQIPVYTVGLGPAAEGDKNAEPDAVKVLRELASDTGGSYASANDPSQLDRLFQNMGTALAKGSCRTSAKVSGASTITPGTKVTGEVTVGTKGAKAAFEFVAPEKK
jgi:Mg-chelatase subunit ChlD